MTKVRELYPPCACCSNMLMLTLTVIEWISVYWFSRAGPTAAGRIYYEMTGGQTRPPFAGTQWQSIPLGVSYFPAEISQLPKSCVPPRHLFFRVYLRSDDHE